ncbi:hypothetical protein D9615_007014 [Tricholomella constricta]|uniref:Uncharacterized protein n=1 Tax=Tricholomella constricta TaxID=117010 RepID=A0A8H5M2F9_9AGAR|nr:hypothetical protein D9615_007014 [Tricholomella constricta]
MATEVPLKIRIDVRDLWNSPKSDLQVSIVALEQTLGHEIVPNVQWHILWDELKDRFPDKGTFVPFISRIVITWYERLLWRLDNNNFPEWTEELLGLLSGGRKQLIIEPSPPPQNRPRTFWDTRTSSFYLGIPNFEPLPHSKIVVVFDHDFEKLLIQDGAADEGWDDLAAESLAPPAAFHSVTSEPRRGVTTHAVNNISSETKPTIERLPSLRELSRPDQLFAQRAPYILTVDTGNPLIIRCSHEASLELISSYLNRWGKLNTGDTLRRNVLKVELIESEFCNGLQDTLSIEPHINFHNGGYQINPTLVLAFIEGVLGYKLVHTNGHNWVYRSDTILNTPTSS